MKRIEQVGIKQATSKGYLECDIGGVADFLYPTSDKRRGRVQKHGQVSPTLTSENIGVCKVEKNELYVKSDEVDWEKCEYKIRKLTPTECLRLMDVSEEDIEKMKSVNSNAQLYKTAGNSIVVSVLCAIFSQLHIQGIKPWNERTLNEKHELLGAKGAEEIRE